MEHIDVLVVGAGISGIDAGYHLAKLCPERSYAIFEGREAMGGTWDLFRYPGIRSDSDMFTLGFGFKPWPGEKSIADGPSIRAYIEDTAREFGIDRHIRYRHKVVGASWDSAAALWTVEVERGDDAQPLRVTCGFLFMCGGYYNYARGHRPHWQDEETFAGSIIEPQFWPADLDHAGKRVIVIGSGATAVTVVPAMARTAAHVTMLQRSPTYIASQPEVDVLANGLRRWLPKSLAYHLVRWRNLMLGAYFFDLCRKKPAQVKKALIDMARAELGPDCDVETHFTPRYDPWTQRLCAVPDNDLFHAIRDGRAEVVTDQIERFTEDGVLLSSGRRLVADIIVAATGLEMQLLGGARITVDGALVDFSRTFNYKGVMFSGVPNFATVFGYLNAAWTLKADLLAVFVCRVLNHMKRRGYVECRPTLADPNMAPAPWFDFSSSYLQRAMAQFPKLGPAAPWIAHQNYFKDLRLFHGAPLEDGTLIFREASADTPTAQPTPALAA